MKPILLIRLGTCQTHDQYEGVGFEDLKMTEEARTSWAEFIDRECFLVYNGKVYDATPEGFARAAEDGLPVPKRKSKYSALDALEVGQNVVIDVPRSSSLSKTIAIRQARDGKKFVRRKVEGGVRVWRVEPGAEGKAKGRTQKKPVDAPAKPSPKDGTAPQENP
jgi:hypothetical protein